MIQVTDSAVKQISRLIEDDPSGSGSFLRIRVEKGGCSGMSYKLDFDKDQKDGDKIIEDKGVKLLVDTNSYLYLVGMTLDFEGGLNGQGFVFNNPNAKKTCGCGSSFGV